MRRHFHRSGDRIQAFWGLCPVASLPNVPDTLLELCITSACLFETGSCFVVQTDFELRIFLPKLPKCCDCRPLPSWLVGHDENRERAEQEVGLASGWLLCAWARAEARAGLSSVHLLVSSCA